jgi:hypothetical protein
MQENSTTDRYKDALSDANMALQGTGYILTIGPRGGVSAVRQQDNPLQELAIAGRQCVILGLSALTTAWDPDWDLDKQIRHLEAQDKLWWQLERLNKFMEKG